MENISINYIDEVINIIFDSIGIKENVNEKEIVKFFNQKKINEGIKEIARYLGLPIEINILYVSNNDFYSKHLVKTDSEGLTSQGIIAQVEIPNYLPIYGALELKNFPINIRISKNCLENLDTFITIITHELSHVVLHSIRHKEKNNEIYTDITAMMLGFSKIIKKGRKLFITDTIKDEGFLFDREKIITKTYTYGYLSDNNFNYAFNKIKNILQKYKKEKKKLINKIEELDKKLKKIKKIIFFFKEYLKYIDSSFKIKIDNDDLSKILIFHQPGYIDQFDQIIIQFEKEIKKFNIFFKNLDHFNRISIETMRRYEEKIFTNFDNLNKNYESLKNDFNILNKYVPFLYKLKIFFKRLINSNYKICLKDIF